MNKEIKYKTENEVMTIEPDKWYTLENLSGHLTNLILKPGRNFKVDLKSKSKLDVRYTDDLVGNPIFNFKNSQRLKGGKHMAFKSDYVTVDQDNPAALIEEYSLLNQVFKQIRSIYEGREIENAWQMTDLTVKALEQVSIQKDEELENRVVTGLVHFPDGESMLHDWVEVYVSTAKGPGWVPMDTVRGVFLSYPTENEAYALKVEMPLFNDLKDKVEMKVDYLEK